LDYVITFEDGQLVDERMAPADGADILGTGTYRVMGLIRAGEITLLDALNAGGTVQGDLGPLATLAGIAESPEFNEAQRATGRHAIALSVLGELDASPFGDALARAAVESDWPG